MGRKMAREITFLETKQYLADIIDEVYSNRMAFEIKKGGKVVARLLPPLQTYDHEKFLKFCDPHRKRLLDEEDIKDYEAILSESRGRQVRIRLPD